ncbi:MAG: protein-tyrosine-phosphatase [Holophagaceae bacterium]|nr:protein-tyrosine-phosphatase [Holophagaceae bacterium]
MLKPLRLLLILLAVLCPVLAQEDGPYVLWKGDEARVFRIHEGKVQEERHRGAFRLALPELTTALTLAPEAPEPVQDDYQAPEKILALSDIHGQLTAARRLLQAHHVVDARGRWSFGRGHLVVVGDTMDRGPQVTEAYWFFRSLESQALRAGGRVHHLLGNHELLLINGDLRYLNPKYAQPPPGLPPISALYGPDSEIGRWLRTRPTLLRLGPFLFVHGGISPAFLTRNLDLNQTNDLIRAALGHSPHPGSEGAFLVHQEGPLWYRGFLPDFSPASTDQEVNRAATRLKVQAFVVGHTTLEQVCTFHHGRVYAIDAGLKDGRPGEAWLWQGGKVRRALADGRVETLP